MKKFIKRVISYLYYRILYIKRTINYLYYRTLDMKRFLKRIPSYLYYKVLWMKSFIRRIPAKAYHLIRDSAVFRYLTGYGFTVNLFTPINYVLSITRRNIVYKNSVLHISYMIHIPYYATRLLRTFGMKADYLAMGGPSTVWQKADYVFIPGNISFIRAWKEFVFFWKVVAKYEVIHSHFAMKLTTSGWEYPVLKRMGRKIVVHYRGCEVRHREKNIILHPDVNICQQCDYNADICTDKVRKNRVALVQKYGDLFLVTTPDMKDFVPDAIHFPFFLPQVQYESYDCLGKKRSAGDEFKIVHVTGHPGIEGTEKIKEAIDHLREKGYPVRFVFLHIVAHDQVLKEMVDADLTIGKMKMGYYANAQIESMFFGVPAVTYVRPEFMTSELENSGFIFTTLKDLEQTLEYYLKHPEELEKKRNIARSSILRLHDNEKLGKQLIKMYDEVKKRR